MFSKISATALGGLELWGSRVLKIMQGDEKCNWWQFWTMWQLREWTEGDEYWNVSVWSIIAGNNWLHVGSDREG